MSERELFPFDISQPLSMYEYAYGIKDPRYSSNLFDCSGMSFSFVCKMKQGAIDHLLQRPTMAAYRYVRSQKRQKEKIRRKKLKEKKHED